MSESTFKLSTCDPAKITLADLLPVADFLVHESTDNLSEEQKTVIRLAEFMRKDRLAEKFQELPFIFRLQKEEGVKVPPRLDQWERARAAEAGVLKE